MKNSTNGLGEMLLDGASPKTENYVQMGKRIADVAGSILLLPLFGLFCAALLLANPIWNRGPLFYVQKRMGYKCRPIRVIKFRSMLPANRVTRGANDPLETTRITGLGRLLRKTRVDELPQILNVLRGDMSLIGPRPDYYRHALEYADTIPGYRSRHEVLPGITGLAQVSVGYVEGTEATRAKVLADLRYVRNLSLRNELSIVIRTIGIILRGGGS